MSSGTPTAPRIVAYFFLAILGLAFCSLFSPLTFGTVQEIPQSPSWGDPVFVHGVPVIRVPSFVVDSYGNVHIVYCDKVGDLLDVFYITVKDGVCSEPVNLTGYPSLKESVVVAMDSAGILYTAFLDNRMGRWQVFLLNVNDSHLIQITDTDTHKEDVSITTEGNKVIITWTALEEGIPRVFLAVIDSGNILVKKCISHNYPSTKSSAAADEERIHVFYLEKHVYDHIMYAQFNFSGESVAVHDLGECIHLDPVMLGIFKGPQFVGNDRIACVWSDARTGSQNLYYTELKKTGEITREPEKLTQYSAGVWSWMPSVADQNGIIHIVYVNNGFGTRLFHAKIKDDYEELGTVTSRTERATAPSLVCDDKGFLHCVYVRFRGDRNYDLVYRNTYPSEKKEIPFSERMEESSIRYLYSFILSFLFAFPLTVGYNFVGMVLLVVGFFAFRFFKPRNIFKKVKGYEYYVLILCISVFFLLRGIVEYSFLALVVYERSFVFYGVVLSAGASLFFKYLLRNRFDLETRILLSGLLFLYSYTFFLLLPIIPHI